MSENQKILLLVEDDHLLAMTETHWLNDAGYEVIHASKGEKAIEIVKEKKGEIDLILMDINLGRGMDGTQAAQEILKDNDVPLLFLSSHTEREVVEKTEKITSYGYVVKDSNEVVLLASIKMAFKLYNANKKLKAKERALAESEARLRRAEFISKFGNWEWDLKLGICTASNGASKIYGITGDFWEISEVKKIPLQEYRPKLDQALHELIELGKPYDIEFKIRKPDTGEIIDIHSIAEYDKNENKIFGVIQDITESKRIEETLLESQAFYYSLVETMEASVFRKNLEGRYVFVNSMFCRLKGLTPGEVIGKTPRELAAYESASDAARPNEIKAVQRTLAIHGVTHHEKILSTGRKIELEEIYPQPDGSVKYYYVIKSPVISSEGKIIGTQGIQFDITERKLVEEELHQSEERFRSFVEKANDIVYTLSLNGTFTYVSPNWTEVLGHDLKEVVGKKFEEFIHPEDIEIWQSFLMNFISSDKKRGGIQYRVKHKSGIWRWHSSNSSIIRDSGGKTISLLGIARDITDQKTAESELQKYTEELKDINATKDKFFSIISHDLKNPFLSINGALNIILDQYDFLSDKEKKQLLIGILTTSEKTYSLLDNLLLWSRNQMGNIEFKSEQVELYGAVLNIIELLKNYASLKNITLVNKIEKDVYVTADRNMLETVLRNLITNSIKYVNDNGMIEISSLPGSDSVKISIKDNGIGIPQDDMKKLFKVDQSFSTKGTNNETGTGLGLIICREFIEMNKGKIWVESENGKGTITSFTLPAA